MPIRSSIVLADDFQPMVNKMLSLLEPDHDVVAVVHNGALAVEAVLRYRPDLVLLDMSLPVLDGIAASHKIRDANLNTKIILISAQINSNCLDIARSLEAGFIYKNRMYSDLLNAVRETLAGNTFYSVDPAIQPGSRATSRP